MNSVSRIALGFAFACGTSVLAAAPADAAKKKVPAPAAAASDIQLKLSKEERTALAPVQTAVTAKNWPAAAAALAAAEPTAQSADARYAVARFRLEIGLATNNTAMQAQAIDEILASGRLQPAQQAIFYRNQAALALNAGNKQKAEAGYTRAVELNPSDPELLISLAQLKNDLKKGPEAMALVDRAIQARRAAGQPVEQSWYRYALRLAYEGKQRPQALKLSRDLVGAYPTKENWRDALLIYRDLTRIDDATNLDLLRLMRASKALAGERDWYDLAYQLQSAALFGEAGAVLAEGQSLKMIDLNKPAFRELSTLVNKRASGDRASLAADEGRAMSSPAGTVAVKLADAYAGYGDYAKAIPLYRAALGKTGVDTNLINMHLGAALAASGQRAEAEAALRAVTGTRAELAGYWLAWLARPNG